MSAAIISTDFQFREELTEKGKPFVIWAAIAVDRVKGQSPIICAASTDETSARLEYNLWHKTYAENGDKRAAIDALWSLKFGQAVS